MLVQRGERRARDAVREVDAREAAFLELRRRRDVGQLLALVLLDARLVRAAMLLRWERGEAV